MQTFNTFNMSHKKAKKRAERRFTLVAINYLLSNFLEAQIMSDRVTPLI